VVARPPGPPALVELQALVDDLADELGRSVVINDPVVRMLCTSRHFGDEDEVRVRAVLQRDAGAEVSRYVLDQGVARWPGAGIVPGRADLGMRDRLCVPLRAGGRLVGLLMVIDADGTLTGGQRARIEEASRTAAALLEPAPADASEREHLVGRLLDDDPDERRAAARAADWPADAEGGGVITVVAVLEVAPDAGPVPEADAVLRTVLASAVRRHPHRHLSAVAGGRGTLVRAGAHPTPDDLLAQVERMVVAADRLLGREGAVVAGLGAPAAGPDSARTSHAQAAAAARGARLVAGLGPVARWESLGPYAILLRLPDPGPVPEPLLRLLRHRSAPRLVATLRAFLDHAGSMPRTAEALHLHRTSLYYRLDRITELTGLDLDDGRDRLLLHLGLLVLDLRGGPGADA
jgi:sugar diacid utilization regulator